MPANGRLTYRWRRRRRADDRGDASIQMAIVYPFVLLAAIAVIQASMWYYARQIALTAAREGVTAARAYQAGPADGTARARQVLGRTAGDSLRSTSVRAGSDGERVRVQVRGVAQSLLPGVPGLTITQSASGPVERWVPGP
ncbi:pilus assembly protein [Streptomyces sp. ME02-6987-2C]|uniref:TadE family protein n=1 Tax=unclassified Streptomyces TaxID=2593676 RepID=UPI0029A377BB|nr:MULTISPECIES: TadE family protein [unclassified Streptomyces]MDX3370277.1 pilus assembly protein [Streptomyces sp. ME02-6987-2C]MDX3425829.1 pilus assembly protein [Streptomyces sp. ME02-6985-2c]